MNGMYSMLFGHRLIHILTMAQGFIGIYTSTIWMQMVSNQHQGKCTGGFNGDMVG